MIIHNPPLSKANILVVEDDDLLLEVLCKTLEREGYSVDAARNGDEALECLASNTYNTVILDLVFRKKYIQGEEVLRRVHAEMSGLPVIVISGSATDETIVRTILTGGFSFLLKPIHPDNLLGLVAEAVQKDKLAKHLSGALETKGQTACIKGVSSEMHVFVKQYALFFEQYLLQTKGLRAALRLESEFDNIRVHFDSDLDKNKLFDAFREYLSFAEQSEPVRPVFSRPISADEMTAFTAQLNTQIRHFAENIEWAFWRISFDLKDQSEEGVATFFINPLKVINGLQVQNQKYTYDTLNRAALQAAKEATQLLAADKTLDALNRLLACCSQYNLSEYSNELVMLRHRWTRAINEKMKNRVSLDHYLMETDEVRNILLFDIIPAFEHLNMQKRA